MSTKDSVSTINKYSLNFFNKTGKIEICRLIFSAANIDYNENSIENITDSDLQPGFLPYLQVDGTLIPCISVISRFLAKEFNLAGKGNLNQAKTDSISQNVMLLIDAFYRKVYNVEDSDQKKIGLKDYLAIDVLNAACEVNSLIKRYQEPGSKYCVGKSLTYADLFVYEMANYMPKEQSFMETYPFIYKVCELVEKEPRIADYFKKFEKINNVESTVPYTITA